MKIHIPVNHDSLNLPGAGKSLTVEKGTSVENSIWFFNGSELLAQIDPKELDALVRCFIAFEDPVTEPVTVVVRDAVTRSPVILLVNPISQGGSILIEMTVNVKGHLASAEVEERKLIVSASLFRKAIQAVLANLT